MNFLKKLISAIVLIPTLVIICMSGFLNHFAEKAFNWAIGEWS